MCRAETTRHNSAAAHSDKRPKQLPKQCYTQVSVHEHTAVIIMHIACLHTDTCLHFHYALTTVNTGCNFVLRVIIRSGAQHCGNCLMQQFFCIRSILQHAVICMQRYRLYAISSHVSSSRQQSAAVAQALTTLCGSHQSLRQCLHDIAQHQRCVCW